MDTLIVRDARCFRGTVELPLAALTFLVGENSTGKSTILALARVAWDIAYGVDSLDFNEDPFQLGAYDEIAHYHGGQGKRVQSYAVGIAFQRSEQDSRLRTSDRVRVLGTFTSSAGQPFLRDLEIESGPWRIGAHRSSDIAVEMRTPTSSYNVQLSSDLFANRAFTAPNLLLALSVLRFRVSGFESMISGEPPRDEELEVLTGLLGSNPVAGYRERTERPQAIAPIRTKPRRTYDPLKEERSPEGDHVPMLLARLSSSGNEEWLRLRKELLRYGTASGLFEDIKVKRFLDSEGSPFQVRVRLDGQRHDANLVDVGYGVSQILPILVDALLEGRRTFLMQQPEVHLHPRAQAELGTFLERLVRIRRHRFLIETHSDHLLDRVRYEVRRGRMPPGDVKIVFLERAESHVDAHPIDLDDRGSPLNPPSSYRAFFLKEELGLLSS